MYLVAPIATLRHHFGAKEAVRIVKDSGFDAYDCPMSNSILTNDAYLDEARELRAYADEIGIPCRQAHALSPYLKNLDAVADCIEGNLRSIRYAAELGAKIVVVHPYCFSATLEEGVIENRDHLFAKLLPVAHELGIKLATENMFVGRKTADGVYQTFPGACGTCDDFVRYIDVIGDDALTACLDIGHASMINCEGAPALIRALGKERIGCLHVHDNDCIHDDHVFPYMGKIDWEEVCRALAEIDYTGDVTFEADAGYCSYPTEALPAATALLATIGRHLISRIEYYKAQK